MLLKDIKVAETQGGGSGHFGTFLHKFRQNRSNKVTFVTVAPQGYKVAETQGGGIGYFGDQHAPRTLGEAFKP